MPDVDGPPLDGTETLSARMERLLSCCDPLKSKPVTVSCCSPTADWQYHGSWDANIYASIDCIVIVLLLMTR